MKRGDMPANPMPMTMMGLDNEHVANEPEFGMTIRERMAMAAMQGISSRHAHMPNVDLSKKAVSLADALLAELERPGCDHE